jgi:hypothetical protein
LIWLVSRISGAGFVIGFPLSHGPAASDERFNYIDIEHFKKGERGQDWSSPLLEMDCGELDRTAPRGKPKFLAA